MKDNLFNDPFFTDKDYMKKKMDRASNTIWVFIAISIVTTVLFYFMVSYMVVQTVQEVEKQGGIGTSIGKFINSVKKEIK